MHSSTQDTPASTSAAGPLEAADPADAAIDVGVAADDAAAADAAAPTADRAFHERPGGSRQVWRRLAADRWALAGGAVVIATTLVALLAPWITRVLGVDPYTYHLDLLTPSGIPAGRLGGISAAHPFGVEPQTGRDLFAVVVEGTRTSFSIGMGATVLSMLIAISLGLSAGYLGGWWDAIVSRLTDIALGFPHLVFMIAISAIIPATAPRVPVMILIIGLLGWPSTARVLRSRTMAVRARTFVGASRAMGAGGLHIMTTPGPAQPRGHHHRAHHHLHPRQDHRRGRPVLPRGGRAPADTVLGPLHRLSHHLGRHRPLVPRLPRRRPVPRDPGLQPLRRRPARRPRPQDR